MTPEEIREQRRALGMTQVEFAAALGLSYAGVQKWEQGTTRPPAYLRLALQQLRADQEARGSERS